MTVGFQDSDVTLQKVIFKIHEFTKNRNYCFYVQFYMVTLFVELEPVLFNICKSILVARFLLEPTKIVQL